MVRTKRITRQGSRDPPQVSQDRRWCRAFEVVVEDGCSGLFFYRLLDEPITKQYKEHVTNID